jgi:hypothetical protein
VQPGHATQAAQYVELPLAVQICTPGVAPTMHKRTSCCMHGHVALIASFHAQTPLAKQVELLYWPHTGRAVSQSALPAHVTPPQRSAPTEGGGAAAHWVSGNAPRASRVRVMTLRIRVAEE